MTPHRRAGESSMTMIASLLGGGLVAWISSLLVEDAGLS